MTGYHTFSGDVLDAGKLCTRERERAESAERKYDELVEQFRRMSAQRMSSFWRT